MDDHKDDKDVRPLIIRRIKKIKKGGHHGGAWKIAYADFVTAMMAFFLVMWLLSLFNKYQLQGIAEYFKDPMRKAFKNVPNQKNTGKESANSKEKMKEQNEKKDPINNNRNGEPSKDKQGTKDNKGDGGKLDKDGKYTKDQKSPSNLQELKQQLQDKLETQPELKQFKNQLNIVLDADGLKIQLKDLENKSMFSTGKADFEKNSSPLIDWLSKELNNYPSQIIITGHTDAAQYPDEKNYSNWELSADRANATRRALIKHGMDPNKIVRVIGMGDSDLLDKDDGMDPTNRRIEITVMTDEAVKKVGGKPKPPLVAPGSKTPAKSAAIPTATIPATIAKPITVKPAAAVTPHAAPVSGVPANTSSNGAAVVAPHATVPVPSTAVPTTPAHTTTSTKPATTTSTPVNTSSTSKTAPIPPTIAAPAKTTSIPLTIAKPGTTSH